MKEKNFLTILDILQYRSRFEREKTAYIFLSDRGNEEIRITYGQLHDRAISVAKILSDRFVAGSTVLLIYPSGVEFIISFLGCLYAGVIAVPVYPPEITKLEAGIERIKNIISDSKAEAILTFSAFNGLADSIFPKIIQTDLINDNFSGDYKVPSYEQHDLAFLQYTSGSTGSPKGVMISHDNIMYNEEMIKRAFQHDKNTVVVGWLPHYHDMGLIGNILQPLYTGFLCILMSPSSFSNNPFFWLKTISRYKATTSGGPNFSYELCVKEKILSQCEDLDLSSWKVCFNGAEPINADTLRKFISAYGDYGLAWESIQPCYGIAEATLLVSCGSADKAPVICEVDRKMIGRSNIKGSYDSGEGSIDIVGCGRTWMDQKIVICDPESSEPCSDNVVGEIWVSGRNVAKGYWGNPKQTKASFDAYLPETCEGPFLRTGDLGFIKTGELFVVSRMKDLIIIHGCNYYPQDIELTLQKKIPDLRPGNGAAFSINIDHQEHLAIVYEVRDEDIDSDSIIFSIRMVVKDSFDLSVYAVALIQPRSIPKTANGKIQRDACKIAFAETKLPVIAKSVMNFENLDLPERNCSVSESLKQVKDGNLRCKLLSDYLLGKISRITQIPIEKLSVDGPILMQIGIDSITALELGTELSSEFSDVEFDMSRLLKGMSISDMAQFIDKQIRPKTSVK